MVKNPEEERLVSLIQQISNIISLDIIILRLVKHHLPRIHTATPHNNSACWNKVMIRKMNFGDRVVYLFYCVSLSFLIVL